MGLLPPALLPMAQRALQQVLRAVRQGLRVMLERQQQLRRQRTALRVAVPRQPVLAMLLAAALQTPTPAQL